MNNVLDELEELERKLQRREKVEKAGVMAADMIRSDIYKGEGFDPLAPVTAAYRGKGRPLQDTNTMRDSISSEMTSPDTVSVGTSSRYAPLHNAGGTIRAKKDWLFIPASGVRTLERKYGKSPSAVIAALKGMNYSIYRVGRTVCARKKEKGAKPRTLYYLKKSVEIPKREFFYLTDSESDRILKELTDDII